MMAQSRDERIARSVAPLQRAREGNRVFKMKDVEEEERMLLGAELSQSTGE